MKQKKIFTLITIGALMFSFAFSLQAQSSRPKSIRAQLNSNYTYSLDGKPILANQPTIVYNKKVYVPLEDYTKALGYTLNLQNTNAAITSSKPSTPVKPSPFPSPSPTTVPSNKQQTVSGIILAIDFGSKRITLLPTGKSNSPNNQVVLTLNDATTITDGKTKKIYTINDLNTDMKITATYTVQSTKSIPPQTQNIANTITIIS